MGDTACAELPRLKRLPIEFAFKASWIVRLLQSWIFPSDTQSDADAPPITTLTGVLPDEAALDHLLDKLYTLGLPLISVEREEADQVAPTGASTSREVDEPDQVI